jgi:hypothetical protein
LAIGDEVYIYDEDGLNIFDTVDPPVIEYISHSTLRINVTAPESIENQLLYIKAPLEDVDNAIIITGVDLATGSNLITFNAETPRGGFLTTEQYNLLASNQVHHTFPVTGAATLPLVIAVRQPHWLTALSLYVSQGSITGYLKVTRDATETSVNSSSITVTAGTVSNTRFTEDSIAAGTVPFVGLLTSPLAIDDLVEFVVTGTTFPEGVTQVMLVGTLDLLRVL